MNKSFEDCIDIINREISKRRGKWQLRAISWMDFDDVSQILRIHIYKKWEMYDQSRMLEPWLNRVMSSQIKNIIRNQYSNYSRPCLRCAANQGDDLCSIYTKQCSECPLFAKWEKTKKRAYDAKLPVSIEDHQQELFSRPEDSINIEKVGKLIHEKMKTTLKPMEWKVYKGLYIDFKSEEEVAKLMGYKTSEKNRMPGYKRLKGIQKLIIVKVKKLLSEDGIDMI